MTTPQFNVLSFGTGPAKEYIDATGAFQVQHLCGDLGIEPATFARLTRRNTESVAKLFSGRHVSPRDPRTAEVLKQLFQIAAIFKAMSWNPEDVGRWLNTPIPTFDGQSPLDLIAKGNGQDLVTRLLALASGDGGS
jgi:uncharacterized protein (DUF2384 family)